MEIANHRLVLGSATLAIIKVEWLPWRERPAASRLAWTAVCANQRAACLQRHGSASCAGEAR